MQDGVDQPPRGEDEASPSGQWTPIRRTASTAPGSKGSCVRYRAARDVPNGARWSVALALGLRQGEALGLLWDAVDLDAGTLTVRRALQRQVGKCLVLVEPKSHAGRRTIKLPDALREALRSHRA